MRLYRKVLAISLSSVMLFSMASCDSLGKLNKSIDTKDILKLAEDYTEALQKFDSKAIKKMSADISKDSLSIIENNSSTKVDLKDVEFEIDEDEIEVDGEEASVEVSYSYYEPNLYFLDSFDPADEEKASGSFTIEVEIEDDEYLVVNSDSIVKKFYDTVIDDADSKHGDSTITVDDYPFYTYSEHYLLEPGDEMNFIISCYYSDDLEGETVHVEVTGPNLETIYVGDHEYVCNENIMISVVPSDYGFEEWPEGQYTCTASIFDNSYASVDFSLVQKPEEAVKPDTGLDHLGGSFENGVYTNEYFGFNLTLPTELVVMDHSVYGKIADNVEVDFLAATSDNKESIENSGNVMDMSAPGYNVVIMVSTMDELEGYNAWDATQLFKDSGVNCTYMDINGAECVLVRGEDNEPDFFMFIKSSEVLQIYVSGTDKLNGEVSVSTMISGN